MKETILTGDRPTGKLHLGHYAGSLISRVKAQNEFDQTILIADIQGLTDNGNNPGLVVDNIINVIADYLAVGIDPEKTTICLQSALPALSELTMYYSNLVTISRLERNPTVKTEIREKDFGRSLPAGFLFYPISQAADITAFKAVVVPCGNDQLPMLEQTNEIVRKFNSIVNKKILKECRPLLSCVPRLPSVDGKQKMSKTLGNAIYLDSTENQIRMAVRKMYTDPGHLKIEDPGKVDGNIVFTYLDAFHPEHKFIESLKSNYKNGGLGDSKIKKILEECLQELIRPIREKREHFINDKSELLKILKKGTERARVITNLNLKAIKESMGLNILDL